VASQAVLVGSLVQMLGTTGAYAGALHRMVTVLAKSLAGTGLLSNSQHGTDMSVFWKSAPGIMICARSQGEQLGRNVGSNTVASAAHP